MESSVIKNASLPGLRGPSPLLRLAPDERLIALVRRGQHAAFETIVSRYQARLLAFCRHMLASREDAEDVLQEVFAAAFNAILADRREINVRPWLYRIARNRCLNHLRRQTAIGVDSMDVHFADAGQSTVEKAAGREDFRLLMSDIRRLPETQRTALLLREMDALSYEQIAEAMETTVPGVKSLLVRARVSLGEAAEARKLSCADVRLELGAIAEGISSSSAPIRRHVKDCRRCRDFRTHLRANNRVLAAALPVGPLLLLKKIALTKLGLSAGAGGASSGGAAAGAATAAGGAATAIGAGGAAGGGGFAGALTAGTLGAKAVAGLAAAALVTAGAAVEVQHAPRHHAATATVAHVRPHAVVVPAVAASAPQPTTTERVFPARPAAARTAATTAKPAAPAVAVPPAPAPAPAPVAVAVAPAVVPPPQTVQQITNASVLPPQPATVPAPDAAAPPAAPVQVIVQATADPAPPAASDPPATVVGTPAPAADPQPSDRGETILAH
jgi:RNA polymerase sigma factor (sigma-70 family)